MHVDVLSGRLGKGCSKDLVTLLHTVVTGVTLHFLVGIRTVHVASSASLLEPATTSFG